MKVLTVSGYKPIEMNIFKPNDHRIEFIRAAMKKRLVTYIEEGLEWVILSGQMGVELWTCQVILDLKEEGYPINLGIFPPFMNQDSRWPEHYQELYQECAMLADFHQEIYQDEYKGPYQFKARDKWLIEKSDACLLLLDEEHPGSTNFFLEEAKKSNDYPILTITPFDLEEIVQEIQEQAPDNWNNH